MPASLLRSQLGERRSTPTRTPTIVARMQPRMATRKVLRMPTMAARPWVLVVGVGDERLADVVAGAGAEEAEVEGLAERSQVLDGVVDQPGGGQHEGEEREDLNGERSVARVVDQHAEPETLGSAPPAMVIACSPHRLRVRPGPRRWRSRHPVRFPGAVARPGPRAGISGTAARRSARRRSTGR